MTRLSLLLLLLSFCFQAEAQSRIESTIFFVGDCGEPTIKDSPLGSVFRREITRAGSKTTVVYLGDNIYPFGLPAEGVPGRERGEDILRTQAGWMDSLGVRGIFIPGNHDWQHWNRNGWEFVVNQQLFIDSLGVKDLSFQPKGGCPGPVEIPLPGNSVLLVIDTQWLLHAYDKPGEESECFARNAAEFMILLDDALVRNKGKRVFITGHHPVITYGDHGGVFSLQDHLFPLVDLQRHLYIPMPVFGSLYPLYRSLIGHPQDLRHPNYKQFSQTLQKMLKQHPGTLYVAGHEHALQHIVRDTVHYIVSGSGSKTTRVKKGKYARFVAGVEGFVKCSVYSDGTSRLEFWQANKDEPEGKIVHQEKLQSVRAFLRKEEEPLRGNDVVKVKASEQYSAGRARQLFLGSNYRNAWSKEVEVPVLYLAQQKGGLRIVQKGGGQQTLSLRLADSTGREYVLRSVEKYPVNAVPEMLRRTFAQDLVQDQISASHPYAALIVPALAEAAGIYHTNPRIVYIPDDPALGMYRNDFRNTLALFEERPADDWSDKAFFGNSKNIINTSKVLERLAKDSDNKVDQPFTVRNRIFDLWIGDWDRHDDQWRWATFDKGNEEVYRPIPRDRDQAFFVNEGALAKVWSRRWALPKFEGFDTEINWASGLSFNARYFDRTFLNELEEKDWVEQAKELQKALTDSVIERSVRQWPKAIFELNGEEIIRSLKARREALVSNAREHYKFLAQQVEVTGSDKPELFIAEREDDGDVHLKVYKLKKGNDREKVYERKFKAGETREIHLYGLGDEDRFVVSGEATNSIKIRIIGGKGKDEVADSSRVRGWSKKTIFYDNIGQNRVYSEGELKDETSADPAVNTYNRKAFRYNRLAPLLFANFNPDDGLFVGGGFLYQKEGFRKSPFAERHIALASVAPRTNSYNFLYRGDFTDVFGRWGLALDADIKSPNYVNNFFGLGNETRFDQSVDENPALNVNREIDYYRFRFSEWKFEGFLTRALSGNSRFSIGPALQLVEVEEQGQGDRFIGEYARSLNYDLFEAQKAYGGLALNFVVDNRNNPRLTTRGVHLALRGRTMKGFNDRSSDFSSYEAAVSLYHSFAWPKGVVLAARAGGGETFGRYDFFQAQTLGGRTELRGFRKTRFYGDSKMFFNLETRIRLFSVRTYLFPASFGVLGFYDRGRVWYEDENGTDPSAGGDSNLWHKGWGGGIWFTPFNMAVLSVEVGHSPEETLGYVRLGFLF